MPLLDLTGERYGYLVVLKREGSDKQGRATWSCLCDCGKTHTVASRHLRSGGARSCGCQRGARSAENGRKNAHKISGSLSYLYKPELTDEERITGRNIVENREWRRAVFERDAYTCDICGEMGKKLAAHHLYNWANHPARRFDQSNGVTLCAKDHKLFHSSLGGPRIPCTADDYKRFKESHV